MKAVITDYEYASIQTEKTLIEEAGFELNDYQLKNTEEIISKVSDADAVITQYADINAEVIAHMKHTRIIIKYGIGVNNIDAHAAAQKGIYVCNVPDYGVDEVSDHAVLLMLALGRKLPLLAGALKQGAWGYESIVPVFRLSECTAGLIGFGRIPRLAAKKLEAFGMKILVYDPFISEDTAREAGVILADLNQILEISDFVSVHCPLTAKTFHMIGEKELIKMKKTAYLVNTARGGVVDDAALIKAIKNGVIAGAGIDVFEDEPISSDHELLHMPNVIATPHCAWYSETAIRTLQRKVAEEVVNVLKGNEPYNCVNRELLKREEK